MTALLIATLLACATPQESVSPVQLIAHRGGVVDGAHPEDSLSSLEEAIRQGYWMVEVDVHMSKDGELVVQHDESLLRVYGVRKEVSDMEWKDLQQLRSRIGGQAPCRFSDYAAACRGKIRVMVDGKKPNGRTDFFEKLEQILKDNDLLKDALFIGSGEMKSYFKGKARVAIGYDGLKRAVEAGEDVSSLYFLFAHGNELDDATVRSAQTQRVPVVPTVNSYHYILQRGDSTPQSDIVRLVRAGVTLFQIDSAYAPYTR